MQLPDLSIPNWRGVLWFWTTHWRWGAAQQRRVLAWWQSVGWEQGAKELLHGAQSLGTRSPAEWQVLLQWGARSDWETNADSRFPWVTLVDPLYPSVLRQYENAPTVLWSNRAWESWDGLVLGVVGSRQSTAYGRLAVSNLIPRFAQNCNALIVSGGARGIDQAAHDAALQVSQPTWVILGCGIAHAPRSLVRFTAAPARLISPFPPNDAAAPWTFPARNQVIAQLSVGVVVVEAAAKSGSLITAAAALEYGKELMVVLPPFTSPNSVGALRLLTQGANPIASWEDIARVLGQGVEHTSLDQGGSEGASPAESVVLKVLAEQGGTLRWGELTQRLSREKNQSLATVNTWITTLELRGKLRVELGVVRLSGMIQS